MTNLQVKAMVLAAGIGSRLQPLTDVLPKPLIKVGGRPIIESIFLLLKKHGIKDVISNTYHLADKMHEYFDSANEKLGMNIEYIHEEKLSGVAGGIRKCKEFLKDSTACIIMGDALTDIDLSILYEKHKKAVAEKDCVVTLAMMKVEDTSQFGVVVTEAMLAGKQPELDADVALNRVSSFQEKPKAEDALSSWANTGVYFFEPKIFDYIPSEQEASSYDVAKDLFPALLNAGEFMQAIPVDKSTYWADLGTPSQYLESLKDIQEAKINLEFLPLINPLAEIDSNAKLSGVNQIGENVKVSSGVSIENSIIYDNIVLPENISIKNSIIGPETDLTAKTEISNQTLANSSSNFSCK